MLCILHICRGTTLSYKDKSLYVVSQLKSYQWWLCDVGSLLAMWFCKDLFFQSGRGSICSNRLLNSTSYSNSRSLRAYGVKIRYSWSQRIGTAINNATFLFIIFNVEHIPRPWPVYFSISTNCSNSWYSLFRCGCPIHPSSFVTIISVVFNKANHLQAGHRWTHNLLTLAQTSV